MRASDGRENALVGYRIVISDSGLEFIELFFSGPPGALKGQRGRRPLVVTKDAITVAPGPCMFENLRRIGRNRYDPVP